MNTTQQSTIGNPAEQKAGDVLLPGYILRRQDGIFIDLTLFPVGGGFEQFIDQLFSRGYRFERLDYSMLMGLLYDYDHILDSHGVNAKVKLAENVVDFPDKRKALYKAVKFDAEYQCAEYFFEPVQMEVVIEEPVYGEPGEDGVAPIVGATRKVELRPTKLNLDEFIADMWLKGVRFGIALESVAAVIARNESVRMDVALQLDPTEGTDAEIEEASQALHRDNAPKILPNGKADLRRFQNRFPQIENGAKLLKKKPRVLGKPGFRVSGVLIEPEVPKDIDISALAGPGTRVEKQGGYEYILATRDGFLALDIENNHISITEKIENKAGISAKTTGDLLLSGDEYIEHGEVQEGRAVEGKNMTFHADVYGDLISQGGHILLESNLSGGSAKSYGGGVTLNGRVFNSTVEAWEGKVTINYAESSLILGESVTIERAVNCEIVGDTVQIGSAEGCGIAGKRVHIKSSTSCRNKENIVSMVLPDISALDTQITQVYKEIGDCKKIIEAKEKSLELLKADTETAKYLSLANSIKQGTIKLNPAQQDNWNKMTARFTKINAEVAKLNADKQEQAKRIQAFQQEINSLQEARAKSGKGIRCEIDAVEDDTLVRTRPLYNGISEFRKINANELRRKLREQGLPKERIFSSCEGSVNWNYALPDIVPLA